MTLAKRPADLLKARWTTAEDEEIRKFWPSSQAVSEIIPLLPGRTLSSIRRRAHELGIKRGWNRGNFGNVVAPVIERSGVSGKACVKCLAWKPITKFARHKTCAGGRRNICHMCAGRMSYASNPAKRIQQVRKYQALHPEVQRNINRNARARAFDQNSNLPGIRLDEMNELSAKYGGRCVYCGDDADTFDHVEPLSRGGLHVIGNLVPCCFPCNRSKKDKQLSAWRGRNTRKGA